jgi:hypothetical protein
MQQVSMLLRGRAGSLQTLMEMKRLVIEAIHSQVPRNIALSIVHSGASNPDNLVLVLKNWIQVHVYLVDEFEELLISPVVMLDEILLSGKTSGDCDDVAMIAASMLASVGADTRLVAVFRQPDGSYGHVFCQYKFPRQDEWRDFDPTINGVGSYPSDDMLVMEIVS